MNKYRKTPVAIEAVQFTGDVGAPEIVALDLASEHDINRGHDIIVIQRPYGLGRTEVHPGDWVIRDTHGSLSACRSDIFEKTYEAVE